MRPSVTCWTPVRDSRSRTASPPCVPSNCQRNSAVARSSAADTPASMRMLWIPMSVSSVIRCACVAALLPIGVAVDVHVAAYDVDLERRRLCQSALNRRSRVLEASPRSVDGRWIQANEPPQRDEVFHHEQWIATALAHGGRAQAESGCRSSLQQRPRMIERCAPARGSRTGNATTRCRAAPARGSRPLPPPRERSGATRQRAATG